MIKAVTVTNYLGDSIKLDLMRPEKSGFIVKGIEGLGPGKADMNFTSIASDDGDLYNTSRRGKRNIILSLGFMATPTIEDVRLKSYKYFPLMRNLTLLIETDSRTAEVSGYVESNEPNIFSENEGCIISILCPNPYFRSAGEDGITETVFSGIVSQFEFSFENNSLNEPMLEFGSIQNLTEQTIYYTGDAETGVTIYIHALGEVENITIYNTRTRELMKIDTYKLEEITGHGILAGDEITICTIKQKKSIFLLRSGITTNILNCLDKKVDWFQLSKGDNIFTYIAEYGGTNLQFRIQSQVVYEGV